MISFGESSFDDIFKPPGLAVTSPAMPGFSHWSKNVSIIVLGRNSAYCRLTFGDSLFYCYFERVASRKLWFFFIRMLDSKEQSKKFKAIIMIGHSALERGDYQKAGIRCRALERVAFYSVVQVHWARHPLSDGEEGGEGEGLVAGCVRRVSEVLQSGQRPLQNMVPGHGAIRLMRTQKRETLKELMFLLCMFFWEQTPNCVV